MNRFLTLPFLFALSAALAATSEIKVDLKLDASDFVIGERVRGVVSIENSSPDTVGQGSFTLTKTDADGLKIPQRKLSFRDRFFVEVFRASDMERLQEVGKPAFVSDFYVDGGEGQKLETFLGDHYALRTPSRYLAKPVLVHDGMRYEGQIRAFDIVEGVKAAGALQMFKNHPGLQREFEVVYWSRDRTEHLFLKAMDVGTSTRRWVTRDLGAILRMDRPTISILPTGEVIVLHRLNQDQFVRSEFWSLPKDLEFRGREAVRDPETAGTARVRELYKDGGVKAKENPWWKFW